MGLRERERERGTRKTDGSSGVEGVGYREVG